MESNYRFDPNPHNTHMLLLNAIPPNSRVLEIGTASGYLGEYLIREKHCEVWGVEPVEDCYKDAQSCGYAKLLNASAEGFLALPEMANEKFDAILLGDVLEHMVNPGEVLNKLRSLLKPDGRMVISLPNIANYTTRWQLLTGRWDLKDGGIMDRTHLRFFTLKTMKAMIESSGLKIEKVRPSSGSIERFGINKLYGVGKKVLFAWPTLFAIQFIFVAKLP